VHCAAEGGNLGLVQWLVEDLLCPLYDAEDAPLLTQAHDSVLGVAARHRRAEVMRWLVVARGSRVNEVGDKGMLWATLDFLLRDDPPLPAPPSARAHAGGCRPAPHGEPGAAQHAKAAVCGVQGQGKAVASGLVFRRSAREESKAEAPATNECIVCMVSQSVSQSVSWSVRW
jgi:hypothetical protein